MLNGLEPFLQRLFLALAHVRVNVSAYEMDHVCYRVETLERYHELCHAWSKYTKDLTFHESLVNGRPIAVFVLASPPKFCGRVIPVIELPAPKEGSPHPEGWEHAEFVIDEPFSDFMSRYEDHPFDRKGLSKAYNPELGLPLGDGMQVKFHHLPLRQVIALERARRIVILPES